MEEEGGGSCGEIMLATNGTFLRGNVEHARVSFALTWTPTAEIYRVDSSVGFQAK